MKKEVLIQDTSSEQIYELDKQMQQLLQNCKKHLSTKDVKLFEQWMKYLITFRNNLSAFRHHKYLQNMYIIRMRNFLEVDYIDATEKDIDNFAFNLETAISKRGTKYAPETKSYFRLVMKQLMAFREYGNKSEQMIKEQGYPKLVKHLKVGVSEKERKLRRIKSSDLLTNEEVHTLIRGMYLLRDRAITELLYDSGCRISEILTLCIKDLEVSEQGYTINLRRSKTNIRKITIAEHTRFMKEYLNQNSDWPNAKEEPLFKTERKKFSKRSFVCSRAYAMALTRTAERKGIKKRVYPHLFRHTRATEFLIRGMNVPMIKKRGGWELGSNTFEKTYAHLNDEDVKKEYMNLIGMGTKETKILGSSKCYNCREMNDTSAKFCGSCGVPQGETALAVLENKKTEPNYFEKMFAQLLAEMIKNKEPVLPEYKPMIAPQK